MPIHVEEAIQEAQRDGRFDNLPGQGKPLTLDPSPDAVVKNLVRNAHMRPEWIEVGLEIDALLERAARQLEFYAQRHAAEFAELTQKPLAKPELLPFWRRWWQIFWHGGENRLNRRDPVTVFNRARDVEMARQATLFHEANQKIRRFNRIVPARDLQRNTIAVAERLECFARRFIKLSHTGDGTLAPLRDTAVPPALLQPKNEGPEALPREVRRQRLLESRH